MSKFGTQAQDSTVLKDGDAAGLAYRQASVLWKLTCVPFIHK